MNVSMTASAPARSSRPRTNALSNSFSFCSIRTNRSKCSLSESHQSFSSSRSNGYPRIFFCHSRLKHRVRVHSARCKAIAHTAIVGNRDVMVDQRFDHRVNGFSVDVHVRGSGMNSPTQVWRFSGANSVSTHNPSRRCLFRVPQLRNQSARCPVMGSPAMRFSIAALASARVTSVQSLNDVAFSRPVLPMRCIFRSSQRVQLN